MNLLLFKGRAERLPEALPIERAKPLGGMMLG